jgi:hypothetical protein
MKRKRFTMPEISLLKWHAFFFVLFTVLLWMSVLSTFSYPGNDELSFDIFKPFLMERMAVNIMWGMMLLAHFGVRAVQDMLQQRLMRLELPNLMEDSYTRLLKIQDDDGVILIDEDGRPFKRRRSS